MKKYYVNYKGFSNTYDVYWAESSEQVAEAERNGYERITRKEAEDLCKDENDRRRNNSGRYASNLIFPVGYERCSDWENDSKVYKDGYMVLFK